MAADPLTSRGRAAGMWPLLPIAVAVFCMSALVYYHVWEGGTTQARSLQQAVIIAVHDFLGFVPAFLLCALGLVWSSIWFLGGALAEPRLRIAKIAGCTLALAIWINLRSAGEAAATHTGALGNAIATRLVDAVGYVPSALLLAPLTLVLFLLATDFLFYRYFDELWVPRDRKAGTRRAVADDGGVGHAETEVFKSLAQAEEAERAAHEAAVAEAAIRETRSGWRERRRRWREAEVPSDPVPVAEPEPQPEASVVEIAIESAPPATEPEPEPAVDQEGPEPEPVVNAEQESPIEPNDEGAGAFASVEGAIAEEIVPEVAPADEVGDPAPTADTEVESSALVEEEVSEDDLARELAVGTAGDGVAMVAPQEPAEEPVPVAESVARDHDVAESTPVAESAGDGMDGAPAPGIEAMEAPSFDPEPATARADEADAEGTMDAEVPADEPVIEIPRPEEDSLRQGTLFGLKRGDDPLVAEAIDLIQQSGRASASYLQRKLRVDFGTASQLLRILAERGVIELDADQSQGRLLR